MGPVVAGYRMPSRVSGELGLEICNTLPARGTTEQREYLLDYPALTYWSVHVGLITDDLAARLRARAEHDAARAGRIVHRVRTLREQVHRAALESGPPTGDLLVAYPAAVAAATYAAHDGGWRLWADAERLETPLHQVVLAAHRALAKRLPVHDCPGVGCGFVFVNRNGRRRWCDMAVCGNRAKARRHAARNR